MTLTFSHPDPLVAALDALRPTQQWAALHTDTHVLTLSAPALRAALKGQAAPVHAQPRGTVGLPHATLVQTCPPPSPQSLTARLSVHQVDFQSAGPARMVTGATSFRNSTETEAVTSFGAVPYSMVNALLMDLDGLQQEACRRLLKDWTIRLNGHRVQADGLLTHLRTAQFPEGVAQVVFDLTRGGPFVRVVFLGPDLLLIGGTPGYVVAVTALEHGALLEPLREVRAAFGVC